jgi:hypothetical protein
MSDATAFLTGATPAPVDEGMARVAAKAGALAQPAPPEALGWPRPAAQGGAAYVDLWHRHFGAGLRRIRLESAGADAAVLDLIGWRGWRRPALGTRFGYIPADRAFVTDAERRLLPLVQLSPPISLEAGNLRGGLQLGPDARLEAALDGLMAALARRRGWDYLTLPVPAPEAALWRAAARRAGMPSLLRDTGRIFHASLSVSGWEARMATASRNFRKNLARAQQRAEEARARVRVLQGDAADEGFAVLRQLADQSTKARTQAEAALYVPFTRRQESFLRECCALPGQEAVTVVLEDDEGPLGAMLWTRRGDTLLGGVTYMVARAQPLSPRLLMVRGIFERGPELGLTRFDFNATDASFDAFADATCAWQDLLLFPPGLKGRLLAALARSRDAGVQVSEDAS